MEYLRKLVESFANIDVVGVYLTIKTNRIMSRIKELKKRLGKPEGVSKSWTAEGKKMIFDFVIGDEKIFWEARLEDGKWRLYVAARKQSSTDFLFNTVLKGWIGSVNLESGKEFWKGRGSEFITDLPDSDEAMETIYNFLIAVVEHMKSLSPSNQDTVSTEELYYDALYLNSSDISESNEVWFREEIDFDYAEISIKAIGIDDPSADEPIFITPIKSTINGFYAVESENGENQFYLTFDSAQIIVNDEILGDNIELAEENGVIVYFSISIDGNELSYEYEDAPAIYYDFQVDLSEPLDVLEANF